MLAFKELSKRFTSFLNEYTFPSQPQQLYDPVRYIMSLGGKRIRPILTLAAYNLYNDNVEKANHAAMTVEVFHNFSLLHDDIMDNAFKRRGKDAVHVKYDENSAILSGDVMMIWSYKLLEQYTENVSELYKVFTQTSIEVCEGQRMDMDFETKDEVSIQEYIQMITLKTSVLLGAALKMGALVGNASNQDQFHLYEFGKNVGIAFQIQDDVLDTFGDEATFGKRIGGDILQKKKTFLYLKSLELLSQLQINRLKDLFSSDYKIEDEDAHIDEVRSLYNKAFVNVHADETKLVYQQLAFSHLDAISADKAKTEVLRSFAEKLLKRKV